MRVGIVGDYSRASAWEKHLRPLHAVDEVLITSNLSEIKEVRACILLNDSENNLQLLSDLIRLGIHTYLVSSLPTSEDKLKKVVSLSQESDVRVQFSHWPSLSPASQWMKQQLPKPDFLQIIKDQTYLNFTEKRSLTTHYWMDEIGWIVKWMDIGIHRIEAQKIIPDYDAGNRIYLKFENGASASLLFMTASESNSHRRIASGGRLLMENSVDQQYVKKTRINEQRGLSVTTHKFDTMKSAELSAMLFFKAIQMKSYTAFTPYDALRVSTVIKKISDLLRLS